VPNETPRPASLFIAIGLYVRRSRDVPATLVPAVRELNRQDATVAMPHFVSDIYLSMGFQNLRPMSGGIDVIRRVKS
jgi:hypothetical protein